MSLRVSRAAALAFSIAVLVVAGPANAQSRSRLAYQGGPTPATPPPKVEPLPPGAASSNGGPHGAYPDGYMSDGYVDGGPYAGPGGGWDDGYGGDESYGGSYGCDDGCCDSCGGYGCDGGCWNRGGIGCNLFGSVCPPGRYYVTADYLYARANFSEAISFLDAQQEQGFATDTFHELDFAYEQSYRFGGGYRLCNCGDEIRFMFTRLSSTANDVAPFGAFVPYEVTAPPDGEVRIHADVDLKTYDLDFARTLQLGGSTCDCCDPCAPRCPAWDITWTGGLRFADVSWNRSYDAVDIEEVTATNAVSVMDFRGGGLKMGLEGRRYFFQNGCFSVYLKGDISLLLGDVKLAAVRETFDASNPEEPDTVTTQTFSSRQIVPVTEIETGLTGHITRNSSITAGYMFSAWHDLGFRDEFTWLTITQMETSYDDANILGFDGFFARLEIAY